jgi:(p)ppGpp synthase/HD superfamily hydrolase
MHLSRAIVIATEAHHGHTDKAGAAYILHPLRVMMQMTTDDERMVAVLHDVVEDCPAWPLDRLRSEGFSEHVLAGIDGVTRREGEAYLDFVRRAGSHWLSRTVKWADLVDNMDTSRLKAITPENARRQDKYREALGVLFVTEPDVSTYRPAALAPPPSGEM